MSDNCSDLEVVEQVEQVYLEFSQGETITISDETTTETIVLEIDNGCEVVTLEFQVTEEKLSFEALQQEPQVIEVVQVLEETRFEFNEICGPDADLIERVLELERRLDEMKLPITYQLSTSKPVPEEGRIFLKRDTLYTSSVPLFYDVDVEIEAVSVSLDAFALNDWSLEIVDDLTGSVIGSILFPAGQRIQTFAPSIPVGSGVPFGVRWSGPSASSWSKSLVELQARQV